MLEGAALGEGRKCLGQGGNFFLEVGGKILCGGVAKIV